MNKIIIFIFCLFAISFGYAKKADLLDENKFIKLTSSLEVNAKKNSEGMMTDAKEIGYYLVQISEMSYVRVP